MAIPISHPRIMQPNIAIPEKKKREQTKHRAPFRWNTKLAKKHRRQETTRHTSKKWTGTHCYSVDDDDDAGRMVTNTGGKPKDIKEVRKLDTYYACWDKVGRD